MFEAVAPGPGLLQLEPCLLPPPHVELDPLAAVADRGVFQQRAEHQQEARAEIHIQGLHVRDLWQRTAADEDYRLLSLYNNLHRHVAPVDGAHEGDHGEHGGDAQPGPGGGRAAVEVEADPGHDHDQAAGHVHLARGQLVTSAGSAR